MSVRTPLHRGKREMQMHKVGVSVIAHTVSPSSMPSAESCREFGLPAITCTTTEGEIAQSEIVWRSSLLDPTRVLKTTAVHDCERGRGC